MTSPSIIIGCGGMRLRLPGWDDNTMAPLPHPGRKGFMWDQSQPRSRCIMVVCLKWMPGRCFSQRFCTDLSLDCTEPWSNLNWSVEVVSLTCLILAGERPNPNAKLPTSDIEGIFMGLQMHGILMLSAECIRSTVEDHPSDLTILLVSYKVFVSYQHIDRFVSFIPVAIALE